MPWHRGTARVRDHDGVAAQQAEADQAGDPEVLGAVDRRDGDSPARATRKYNSTSMNQKCHWSDHWAWSPRTCWSISGFRHVAVRDDEPADPDALGTNTRAALRRMPRTRDVRSRVSWKRAVPPGGQQQRVGPAGDVGEVGVVREDEQDRDGAQHDPGLDLAPPARAATLCGAARTARRRLRPALPGQAPRPGQVPVRGQRAERAEPQRDLDVGERVTAEVHEAARPGAEGVEEARGIATTSAELISALGPGARPAGGVLVMAAMAA